MSTLPDCLCDSGDWPHWHHDLLCPKRSSDGCEECERTEPRLAFPKSDQHRPEMFSTICRDCGGQDVYFARRPGRDLLRAVCPSCGIWEYIE
jgi:hypothetical protein